MNLPDAIAEFRAEMHRALEAPLEAFWPEGEAYRRAEQPAAIAAVLIPILHEHLEAPKRAKIAYLFREEIKDKWGVAGRVGGKVQFLTDYDFTIDFNWTAWKELTLEQRIALVDHELCHCAWDDDKERWVVREHDVEEFGEIVKRWGMWRPALAKFGHAVRNALQIEMALELGAD